MTIPLPALIPLALTGAEFVALFCLVLGAALIGSGAWLGIQATRKPLVKAKEKIANASGKLDEAHQSIVKTRDRLDSLSRGGLESVELANVGQEVSGAAAAAASSTTDAKSALEQVSGIVGSLPEHLRFAGMQVLVGAVLVGVATVQYGGTALF